MHFSHCLLSFYCLTHQRTAPTFMQHELLVPVGACVCVCGCNVVRVSQQNFFTAINAKVQTTSHTFMAACIPILYMYMHTLYIYMLCNCVCSQCCISSIYCDACGKLKSSQPIYIVAAVVIVVAVVLVALVVVHTATSYKWVHKFPLFSCLFLFGKWKKEMAKILKIV